MKSRPETRLPDSKRDFQTQKETSRIGNELFFRKKLAKNNWFVMSNQSRLLCPRQVLDFHDLLSSECGTLRWTLIQVQLDLFSHVIGIVFLTTLFISTRGWSTSGNEGVLFVFVVNPIKIARTGSGHRAFHDCNDWCSRWVTSNPNYKYRISSNRSPGV